uniref:Tenascin-R n=1 Tax=Ciona savignyi TaxID=51511 RepID=H2YMB9_CIOSA
GRRSCVNDCNGHGRCEEESGRCRCNGNWEGDDCSVRRCPRDCSGHGECINGRCRCDEQWAGKACRVLRCLNGCSSNGKCRNGTCECSQEWTGPDCSAPQCPSGCSGLGQCKNGACECFEGWGGLDCGQPICPDDCSSNGQCVDGRCRCWGGWDGISCSEVVQPSGLQISNIQPTTIDVSWTKASSAVTANQVNCIPMEGTANAVYQTVGPNVTKLTIRDLDSGTQYSVFVYAMIGEALSAPITASVKTGVDTPSQLNYLRIGDTFAEITWTPPQAKVDRYKMVCSCKQGGAEIQNPTSTVLPNKTSVLIKDLSPGETYTVALYAVQGENTSAPIHINFTTSLDAPASVEFVDVTSSSATVRWAASVAKITGYQFSLVEFGVAPLSSFDLPYQVYGGSFDGLFPGSKYVVEVMSVERGVKSGPLVKRVMTGIDKPTHLRVQAVTPTSVIVTWNATQANVEGYSLECIDVRRKHVEEIKASSDTTSTVLEGLEPGTEYLISVFTIYNERGSIPVQLSIKTAIDPPSRLMFVTVSDSAFTIHWQKPVAMVSNYIVTYYRSKDEHEVPVKGRKNTSYMLMALRPGILYYVSLATERHERVSFPPVTERFVTSQPLTAPPVVEVSFTGARITWTPNTPDADGHNITLSRVRQSRMQFSIRLSSKSRVVAFNDLLPGTRYRVTIATMRGNTTSKPQVLKFKTDEKLAPPTNISVSLIGETGVNISWIVPSQKFDRIYFSYTSDDETETDSTYVGKHSGHLVLSQLTPDTLYHAQVAAKFRRKTSFFCSIFTQTPDYIIPSPTQIRFTSVNKTRLTTRWHKASERAQYYRIAYQDEDGTQRTVTISSRSTQLPLEHLKAGTTYNISVTALGRSKESFPLVGSVTTLLNPPSNLNVTTKSSKSVELTWKSLLNDVDGYVIKYHELESRSRRPNMIMRRNMKVIHMQSNTTKYVFQVVARKDGRESYSMRKIVETAKVPYLQPKDCVQVSLNGEKSDDVYEIFPYNGIKLKVFCDLTTDGGGWIVFQRRRDGSVSFDRSWEDYTTGFGNLTSEFWIGLQTLHELTTAMDAPQSLRIDLHHGDDKSYAAYHNFSISNSDDRFVLSASNYSGTAGDSLSYHYGMKFTTYDSDNDEATRNCAKEYKGAWWFKNCHRSSLNGQYGNSR